MAFLPTLNGSLKDWGYAELPEDFAVSSPLGVAVVVGIGAAVGVAQTASGRKGPLNYGVLAAELAFAGGDGRDVVEGATTAAVTLRGGDGNVPPQPSPQPPVPLPLSKKVCNVFVALLGFLVVVAMMYIGSSCPKFLHYYRVGKLAGLAVGGVAKTVWNGQFRQMPGPDASMLDAL